MPLRDVGWLILDLDNTLLDFDRAAKRSLISTYRRFGISTDEVHINAYRQINHRCWRAFEAGEIDVATLKNLRFQMLVEDLAISINPDQINSFYLNTLSKQIDPMPGALEFLKWADNNFSLVLATNGFKQVQRPRIASSGISAHFKHIIISEEIGFNKPDKEFFDHTFHRMEGPAKNEVMIIGDNLGSDIKGGADYGILTCWLNNGDITKPQNAPTPDLSIHKLHDLLKYHSS